MMNEGQAEGNKKKRKPIKVWKVCLGILILILIMALREVRIWCGRTFGRVSFTQVVYHINAPLKGTDSTVFKEYFAPLWVDLYFLAAVILLVFSPDIIRLVLQLMRKQNTQNDTDSEQPEERSAFAKFVRKCGTGVETCRKFLIRRLIPISLIGLFIVLVIDVRWFGIVPWVKHQLQSSTVYEDYYVDPNAVRITAPEQKKNLILIISESMEATFGTQEVGGTSEAVLIPNLTRLAKENTHFSRRDDLMGGAEVNGTEWTIAAMVAFTAGIPLDLPIEPNAVWGKEQFLPGVTSLGEILEANGYVNEMIVGSDKSFAGKNSYFEDHGNYHEFDLYSALEEGYIENANDFWGYDDETLFRIARDRIAKTAEEGKPFQFILNTVDLHNPNGYLCAQCRDDYRKSVGGDAGQYMDVICCQDHLINEFVEWCRTQDFYENTVIVILGDHTSMASIVETEMAPKEYERTAYNVIINSELEPTNTANRRFTSMDMFPTILASLGFQIEGERLGLGTNLYSGKETVTELLGLEKYKDEIAKNSRMYNRVFLKRKK